jgi:hypothetical protein
MKEGLCRPDNDHYCVECCPPGCPLLGDMGGGRTGCLGHNGKRFEGLTERSICLDLDCMEDFSAEDRKTIREAVSNMLPGRFQMSKVLAQFKIANRVCAWCKPPRIIGRKLGLEGDTHTLCEECEKRVMAE